ncbi:MAG: HAD hydrolase family protein [Candidatus Neomarinimicrobiota bacterium]
MNDRDLARIKVVKAVFTDVDGVLTDGSIYVGSNGEELKRFTVEDGVGASLARQAGLTLAFISGRKSDATLARAKQMRVEEVYQGYLNKLEPFEFLLNKLHLQPEEVAYIGDGFIDMPLLERVGVPVSVPNAAPIVKDLAMYITSCSGGQGVLAEVVQWILKNQGRLEEVLTGIRAEIYRAE